MSDATNLTNSTSVFNSLTGLLGKAIDVAPDIYELKKTGVRLGSVSPSGASNPAAVQNEKTQERQEKIADGTYKKYILWGVGGLAVIGLVAYLVKKA